MRLIPCALLISIMAVAPLCGTENDKEVEDDLDAIVPQKSGQEVGAKKDGQKQAESEPENAVIAAIVLPEQPTKTDVVKYLTALHAYGKRMPRVAPAGAPVGTIIRPPAYPIHAVKKKLEAIPTQYIGEAISYAAKEDGVLSFRYAIVDLVNGRKDLDDSHREVVLRNLYDCPDLIVTVARYGWEKGQEKLILKTLRAVQQREGQRTSIRLNCRRLGYYVPVLVEYGSDASQKALMELLTNRVSSREMASCFAALPKTEIPWLNRSEVVAKAWKKALESAGSGGFGPEQYAAIAAKYGQLDALVFIARKLNGTPSQNRADVEIRTQMSEVLRQLVPAGGSNEGAIVRYVLANRTTLIFDKDLQVYRLP